jgi:hypothetical protein
MQSPEFKPQTHRQINKNFKTKQHSGRGGGIAQVVAHLPCKQKASEPNPSKGKKKKAL